MILYFKKETREYEKQTKKEKRKIQGLGSNVVDIILDVLSSIFLFWK